MRYFRGMLFVWLLSIMLTACGREEQNVLWTVPYNTESENSLSFIAHYGEWKRSLGLYSFLATENILVLEDSVHHRIAVYRKELEPSYIMMPEQMICQEMGYDLENNTLYLLLYDNYAVEPRTYKYCKVLLDDKLELQEIKDVEILSMVEYESTQILQETDLDSRGNVIVQTNYLEEADISSALKNLSISQEFERSNLFFYTQCGDSALYACYDATKGGKMFLLLVREGKIIAYSQVLEVGEILRPASTCAYMYESGDTIEVVYMYIEENQLKVSEVEMESIE